MKLFSYYVNLQLVKKQPPDDHTAIATAKDAFERIEFCQSIIGNEKPKYVLENAYEAIREIADAVLYARGYKSYSHEASIAFLAELGVLDSEVLKIDHLRKHRNGIKYYGEGATTQQAKNALECARAMVERLRKILKL